MKPLLIPILIALSIISCRKSIESEQKQLSYLNNVNKCLKDSLTASDYKNIDLSKAIVTHGDSVVNFLRVPFKGIGIWQRFVLVKTNSSGSILQGAIIDLTKEVTESDNRLIYNGLIEIRFLNETLKVRSKIKNGYITQFHSKDESLRSLVVPTEAHVLPEVVVTCYVTSVESFSYSDWLNISSLLGGGSDGYYSSLGNYGGGGDGSGGGVLTPDNGDTRYGSYQNGGPLNSETSYDGQLKDNPILVDFEFTDALTPINIDKYLKCFSNIPDAGSTCSIEIFSDIPVDDHPDVFFDWNTGSPGHTFLQIQKTLGNQTVVQNIGFYPVHGWKTITTGPVEGMFVDNSSHEYNAGLKMYLTPDQLKNTLSQMSKLAHQVKYDIDEYNCTDFALDIFNFSRPANPLEIPKYHLTGSTAPSGSNTPQGLYKKIVQMQGVSVEAPNITIPHSKQFVTRSSGSCN